MVERFNTLHEPLQERRSGRAFVPRPIDLETLMTLLEATRWAPSCSNFQPWRFVVASTPEALSRLHGALNRGNAWAKQAPALIALASRKDLGKVGADGREFFLFDAGLGVENLLIQAVSMGLMCHPMAGFDQQKAREALSIPADFTVICLIAVGYPGDPSALEDEELRRRETAPRQRKALDEIASFERWDDRLNPPASGSQS